MVTRGWTLVAAVLALAGTAPVYSGEARASAGNYDGAQKTLVPGKSWPCGMPDGIPVPERGKLVFEATMQLDQVYDLGETLYGHRTVAVIGGGAIRGEKLHGTVMAGSLDFQLGFANGVREIEQVLVLKTDDGKYIYVRNPGTAGDERDVRMVPDFEAPTASDHAWLNTGKFVGRRTVDFAAKTMKLTVYDVSGIEIDSSANAVVRVAKPAGHPDQPWDYRRMGANEKRGEQLIVENVTLSPSQSVGATKNGGRNIIPITGGKFTGKISGKVLAGGADYQKQANPFTLDARYLWQTDEGDMIIVRNAGPIAQLVPAFEVPVKSKYAWLNKGTYLSSPPGMGQGGVALTFCESVAEVR